MSNGHVNPHERFFKLWAKVSTLCVENKRHITFVLRSLTEITGQPLEGKDFYRTVNRTVAEILNDDARIASAIEALQQILDGPVPVFMEFSSDDRKHHFVGISASCILQDTRNFGLDPNCPYRFMSESEIRSLGLRFIDDGIAAVIKGCPSYWLTNK